MRFSYTAMLLLAWNVCATQSLAQLMTSLEKAPEEPETLEQADTPVIIESSDFLLFAIDRDLAYLSQTLKNLVEDIGSDEVISFPEISAATLERIFILMPMARAPAAEIANLQTADLIEFLNAVNFLDVPHLFELALTETQRRLFDLDSTDSVEFAEETRVLELIMNSLTDDVRASIAERYPEIAEQLAESHCIRHGAKRSRAKAITIGGFVACTISIVGIPHVILECYRLKNKPIGRTLRVLSRLSRSLAFPVVMFTLPISASIGTAAGGIGAATKKHRDKARLRKRLTLLTNSQPQ